MFPQIRTGERVLPTNPQPGAQPDRPGRPAKTPSASPTTPVSLTEARPTPCCDPVTEQAAATPEILHTTLLHVLKSLESALSALSNPGTSSEESLRVATEELRCAKGALKLPLTQGEMPAEARAAHAAQRADPSHSPHFGG